MQIAYFKKLGEPWASRKDKKYLGETRVLLKREVEKIILEEILEDMILKKEVKKIILEETLKF